MRGDAIKGHLDLLLLAVIETRPVHGYAVIEELRRRSEDSFDLPEGTVYPALHRLEREGLLASRWDTSSARKRRIYSVTKSGLRSLAERRSDWQGFARAVGSVVGDPP